MKSHEPESSLDLKSVASALVKLVAWLCLITLMAFFFGSLVISFWSYYDLGIGYPANTFAICAMYVPGMFILLGIFVSASHLASNRTRVPYWVRFPITLLVSILIVFLGFLCEVWRSSPNIADLDLMDFLSRYSSGTLF